jgi:hypothetical protein
MADPRYARGKLLEAVRWLAKHPGEIRARLIVACDQGLVAVSDSDMPTPELVHQWRSIRARIAGVGTVFENSAFEVVAEDIQDLSAALDAHLRA